jgi:hypothetical protein
MPWFRMYADFLNDHKIVSLAFEDQRHYVGVLALKCSGVIDQECAPELLNRIVAQRLWVDHSAIAEVKRRLVAAGLIGEDWQPLAWDKRQYRSDGDPTNAERQRRYKDKKRQEANAAQQAAQDATKAAAGADLAERVTGDGNEPGNAGNAVTGALPNGAGNAPVTGADTDTEAEKKQKTHTPPEGGGAPPDGGADGSKAKDIVARYLVKEGVSAQHAKDWIKARKAKRLPLTLTAWEGVCREAEKAGLTPAAAVHVAAEMSWGGFKAHWIEQETNKLGGAWWTNDGLMLAKAMQVGVGAALAGESRDAWKARINAAIDNGGTPPAPRPVPVTPADPVPPRPDPHRTQPSATSRAAMAQTKQLLKSKSFGGTPADQQGDNA